MPISIGPTNYYWLTILAATVEKHRSPQAWFTGESCQMSTPCSWTSIMLSVDRKRCMQISRVLPCLTIKCCIGNSAESSWGTSKNVKDSYGIEYLSCLALGIRGPGELYTDTARKRIIITPYGTDFLSIIDRGTIIPHSLASDIGSCAERNIPVGN